MKVNEKEIWLMDILSGMLQNFCEIKEEEALDFVIVFMNKLKEKRIKIK